MIDILRKMLRRPMHMKLENTAPAHNATLTRADRLLRLVQEYRDAEQRRTRR